jgi:hypothetical protein
MMYRLKHAPFPNFSFLVKNLSYVTYIFFVGNNSHHETGGFCPQSV